MDKAFQADAFYYSEIFFTEAIADGVPHQTGQVHPGRLDCEIRHVSSHIVERSLVGVEHVPW